MKGFEVDPKERAILRSNLPDELIAVVDQAEEAMEKRTDETIAEFKKNVNTRLAEFTERDFAREMEDALAEQQKELTEELSKSVGDLKAKVEALNSAVAAATQVDPALLKQLAALAAAQSSLDATLNETRKKVAAVGTSAAMLAKKAVGAALGGLF